MRRYIRNPIQHVKIMRIKDCYEQGNCSIEEGNYLNAVDFYRKCVEINPENAGDFFIRGLAHSKLGNHKKAIEDFSKAIEMNPDYTDAYNARKLSYIIQSIKQDNNKEEADEEINCSQFVFENAEDFYIAGVYCSKSDYHKKAIENFSKAIEMNPRYADAYNARAECYKKLSDTKHAIDDFYKAIEIKPDIEGAYKNLQEIYGIQRDDQPTFGEDANECLGSTEYHWQEKSIPTFSETELEIIDRLAQTDSYFQKISEFVNHYIEESDECFTQKQITWLWEIKNHISDYDR